MKKWNLMNLIMNDNTNNYQIQVTDDEHQTHTLITSDNFKKILKQRYSQFALLTPSYYDTETNEHIELVTSRADAIDWFYNVFSTWKLDRQDGFLKLYEALRAKYNPITNYDKTIQSTTEYKGTETNTNTPTGKEINKNTPSGIETVTKTPSGTETKTVGYAGTEVNVHAIDGTEKNSKTYSGTETNTNTPSGSEQETLTKSGSEAVTHSIGQRVSTTAKTAYNDETFKDAEKTTEAAAQDSDTTNFTSRQDTNVKSFNNRSTTDQKSFTNRKDEDTKTFTNRQDTDTKSFTNRQDTETMSYTNRQDEEVKSFTNRQTIDELSFDNRQTTDVKSFTDRVDEYNYREFGNIGVTTSQQMIESQFPLTEKDQLMHYIVNLFVHENLII